MDTPIAEGWASFEAKILSDPAIGSIQRAEMKKAFYGGALISYITLVNCPDNEEAVMQVFEVIGHEVRAFANSLPQNPVIPLHD